MISENILLRVLKYDVIHSGHERGIIKETKKAQQFPASLDLSYVHGITPRIQDVCAINRKLATFYMVRLRGCLNNLTERPSIQKH